MPQQFVGIVLCLAMIDCTFQVCKVHGAAVHGNVKKPERRVSMFAEHDAFQQVVFKGTDSLVWQG